MNCKTWKKLLAVLLTLATVLSMSMAAFATGGSVTLVIDATDPIVSVFSTGCQHFYRSITNSVSSFLC